MAEAAISVDGVSKSFRIYKERNQSLKYVALRRRRLEYESFKALDNLSVEIEAGSAFAIIGPNGSGKSTTLKILAQILQPDAGTVTVRGRVSALLELGAGFHPELSGRENVFLNSSILGIPQRTAKAKFDDIVEFSGLGQFIDNPVKTYSSGMYARLGFAVAVNVDPDILIIDEVLAVGDESFQRQCGEKISQMRHEGRTVVLVSHGLGQVQAMCDKAIWIQAGRVQHEGDAVEVVNHYLASLASVELTLHESSELTEVDEARVSTVRFTDRAGKPLPGVVSGQSLTIEVTIETRRGLKDPVIGVWVNRSDGVLVCATRTQHQLHLESLPQGKSTLTFSMPRFDVLPGRYFVGVAVADDTVQHIYDTVEQAVTFDVAPNADRAYQAGMVRMEGTWSQAAMSESER